MMSMEEDRDFKLKGWYLHKAENHVTTHHHGRRGAGGLDDDNLFQSFSADILFSTANDDNPFDDNLFGDNLFGDFLLVNCGLVSPNVVEDGGGSVDGSCFQEFISLRHSFIFDEPSTFVWHGLFILTLCGYKLTCRSCNSSIKNKKLTVV
jgi:hypothetical protein